MSELDLSQISRRTEAERDYWIDQLRLEVKRLREPEGAVVVHSGGAVFATCKRCDEGVVVQAARAVVAEWLRWMRELPDDFQIDGPVMVAIHKLSTLIPKEDNE